MTMFWFCSRAASRASTEISSPAPTSARAFSGSGLLSGLLLAAAVAVLACSDESKPTDSSNGNTSAGAGGATAGVPGTAGGTSGNAAGAGDSGAAQPSAAGGTTGATPTTGGTPGAAGGTGSRDAGTGPVADSGAAMAGGDASAGGDGGASAAGGCTRDALKSGVDAFFMALAAHDATKLSLASSVKFTENGKTLMTSEGLFKTAGMVKWKISAIDTMNCSTVTESVVPDGSTDIPFGLRLKYVDGKIAEIETVAVRDGDYFVAANTGAMMRVKPEDWETIESADKQTPRAKMEGVVNDYFKRFPVGACGFAADCKRLENGFSPGMCVDGSLVKCDMSGSGSSPMTPRLILIDPEAGIAVGFVMFAGSYTDFHMFKFTASEVHGVHAVLAKASSSGWGM